MLSTGNLKTLKRRGALLIASAGTLMLAACQTSQKNGPASNGATFCQIAAPIYLSPKDKLTDRTATAIVDQNEIGEALCGWKP